jgi:hypothetical protein
MRRNILEYPITLDEIVDCLKQLRDRESQAKNDQR